MVMSEQHTAPSWTDGPFLGFDTETTGVDPSQDRLVTAALVMRGPRHGEGTRRQEVVTWLADPGVPIPPGASAVHGISTERAQAEGRPAPQVLEEVAQRLAQAMGAGTPVVAFNASFDLTLMEHELARHGLATLRERLGGPLAPVLDPLVLDRAVDLAHGVQVDEALHTAEVDVAATLDVLEALAHAYPELAQMSLSQLQSFQASSHRAWAQSFNDWLRRQGRPADVDPSWPLASES